MRRPHPVEIPAGESHAFAIDLTFGSVAGTVRDAAGDAVAATVHLSRIDTVMFLPEAERPRTERAAGDGSFRCDDVDADEYRVTAYAERGAATSGPLLVEGGETRAELTLAPVVGLSGIVRAPGGSAPARALVYSFDGSGTPLGRMPTQVRKDGTFEVRAFPSAGGVLLAVAAVPL